MTSFNPSTTAEVPPLPIWGEPVDGLPTLVGFEPGYRLDGDPKYAGLLPQFEVTPETPSHDFGESAVKWLAPTLADLLAAATAAVEAGAVPADLLARDPA